MGKNKYLLKEQNVKAEQKTDASVSSVRQGKFTALASRFKVKPTETEIRKTKAEDEGGWANFEEYNKSLAESASSKRPASPPRARQAARGLEDTEELQVTFKPQERPNMPRRATGDEGLSDEISFSAKSHEIERPKTPKRPTGDAGLDEELEVTFKPQERPKQ